MQIFAGLGNPGASYALNRHNVGFMAADVVHDSYRFTPWRLRFQGWVAEGQVGGEKLLLLKPATFMNESGRSVGEALRFYKLGPEALTVIYDELDLAPGKVRVKTAGGAAGHNGIRSIDAHVGPEYRRVRIGIGHPGHKDRVLGHALGNFAKAEVAGWLPDVLGAVSAELPWLVAGDDARFMNEVARRTSGED